MVTALNQLSQDWNFNPNFWEGMYKGVYSRSSYIPDFVYNNILKNNAVMNQDGTFNFAVIFSLDEWPVEGSMFSLD